MKLLGLIKEPQIISFKIVYILYNKFYSVLIRIINIYNALSLNISFYHDLIELKIHRINLAYLTKIILYNFKGNNPGFFY